MNEKASVVERVASWPVRVKNYVAEVQAEMRRVTWPTWKQVRATTAVVIVAVFAFAAYFFAVDYILGRAITKVFDAFTR
ncbi:MAG TPA: preprotein translocase subunit SecE [Bryobacteraceae bacterium]|nr:preprotein translocase subunit SecE [Bryobacteraceae bacterium]